MKFDVLTLFPEMFKSLEESIIGKAKEKNLIDINLINIRDFSKDKHKKVDDTPYGGGAGMVMKADVVYDAFKSIKQDNAKVIYLTPQGKTLNQKKVEELSKEIPIFRSSNMSLDINLMANIVQKIAEVLKQSDIEIIETHHNRKIDSPSGTAILLADAINEVFEGEKKYNFERMQKREKRNKNEIGFSSIRGGNIVGEHSVQFFGENETLEITHKAYSRQVFAEGAIKAAEFIVKQPAGLYNMKDLVK